MPEHKEKVPEECIRCPKTIEAYANCGHVECPFKLSPMDRATLFRHLKTGNSDDGRHIIPTLSGR